MSSSSQACACVYAIVGTERLFLLDALQGIKDAMGEAFDPASVVEVDGSKAKLVDVLDEVRTLSLLGGRRLVIVDAADTFISANRAALERYCKDPAVDGTLVLICKTLPKNTRLYKLIAASGTVFVCESPKGRGVSSWLVSRAKTTYGKHVGFEAARRLRDHVGDSITALDAELAKLSVFVGRRSEISEQDIEALTGRHREEKVFAVSDAMTAGDVRSALSHWDQVMATDLAAPARAVAGLAWGVRRLRDAKIDFDNGVSVAMLARKLYSDPAAVKRTLQRCSLDMLEGLQADLVGAEVAVKTGLSTVSSTVEKMIIRRTPS